MKKTLVSIFVVFVIYQIFGFAQIKTTFTPEVRPEGFSIDGGIAEGKENHNRNKKDEKIPSITRGVERFERLNIFGQKIPDSFLFYRGILNERQQVVYDQIQKAVLNAEEMVVLGAKLKYPELKEVIQSVFMDNAEAFWWEKDFSYWDNSDGYVTKVSLEYLFPQDKMQEAYEKFWVMTTPVIYYASMLPDEMSKIKYVHDYICLSTVYDSAVAGTPNNGGLKQTAYSCAVDYLTVCAGYAACFQYYMHQLGIPCTRLDSDSHRWNLLKVNGQYYQMDVTWDDEEFIPKQFNLPHQEMQNLKIHDLWYLSQKIVDKYPSTSDEMSYINYYGLLQQCKTYTYQELAHFDSSLADQTYKYVNVAPVTPIKEISTTKEFRDLMIVQMLSTDSLTFKVVCGTKNSDLYNEIIDTYNNSSYFDNAVFSLREECKSFGWYRERSYYKDYQILEFDVTLKL